MTHPNDTLRQALIILRNNGDRHMHGLNRAITPRPSEVLAAMDSHRAKAIYVHDDEDDEDDTLELLPLTASAEDEAVRYLELRDAVGELTPKQRRVIELLYYEGLDSVQAGKVLSCTGANIRLHHKKALTRLRETLSEG